MVTRLKVFTSAAYLIVTSACAFGEFFDNCSSEVSAHDKVDDRIEDGMNEGQKKQTHSSPTQ